MYTIPVNKEYTTETPFNIDDLYDQHNIIKTVETYDDPINTNSLGNYIYRQPKHKASNAGRLLVARGLEVSGSSRTFGTNAHATYTFEKLPITNDFKLVLLCRGIQAVNPDTHVKYGHNQIMVDVTIQGHTKRVLATYAGAAHTPIGTQPPSVASSNIKIDASGLAWYTIPLASLYESVVMGKTGTIQ